MSSVNIVSKRMSSDIASLPISCDTFVVLPPLTADGCVIFGKNSDRPKGEVQEVIMVPAQEHPSPSKLTCTYIEIDQVMHTHSVILSKPAWMWGAEMGANEHGVCIGNEAVWTKLNGSDDATERLLGMDLVRIGLERSASAKEALDIITFLLEAHGQGGPCSDSDPSFTYHNSFLIADRTEAWVLETAGRMWAAQHITSGFHNISNCLSIGTTIDAMSTDLKKYAEANQYWDPSEGDFHFAKAYSSNGDTCRLTAGRKLLEQMSNSGAFLVSDMFTILRDGDSGICRGLDSSFPTTGSQVSVLPPSDSVRPCCHWFTGTPDPKHSVFKPFIFCPKARISSHIQSCVLPITEDPAKTIPSFQRTIDRRHNLYKLHEKALQLMNSDNPKGEELQVLLQSLEKRCVEDMEIFLTNFTPESIPEAEDLFKDIVESEMKFYK